MRGAIESFQPKRFLAANAWARTPRLAYHCAIVANSPGAPFAGPSRVAAFA
jgi:hypothetical protein